MSNLPKYINPADCPECLYCFSDADFAANIREVSGGRSKGTVYCCEIHRHRLEAEYKTFYIAVAGLNENFALTDIPGKTTILNILTR